MQGPEAETLSEAFIAQIEPWYHQSQMLRLWELLRAHPPLWTWTGCRSRTWAGRLAASLGSERLSQVLHRRNYQRHPRDLSAGVFYAHNLARQQGCWQARQFLQAMPEPGETVDAETCHYFWTLRAMVEADFRDFETAADYMRRAEAYAVELPWGKVCQASILERQDRYEEALALARAAVEASPLYRPAILSTAHFLQVLDRDEEALAFLRAAVQRAACAPIAAALTCLELDLGLQAEALATLEHFVQVAPLADRSVHHWVARSRTTLACRAGDLDGARQHCARVLELSRHRDVWHRELARRLDLPDPPRRRRCLAVNFVRQHHKTCAPATLAALAQYWQQPINHLEIAEQICYDGTPSHSQRRWAESQGLVTREFSVTWEAALALIDRGVPFALTTVEVNSGHLQALVGYDELRQSLLLRDPYHYYLSEAIWPRFQQSYAPFGPRGLVMLPPTEAHRLEGLELPDAALFDQLHAVQCALEKHQRDQAAAALAALSQSHPNHWITCSAGWALSAYDVNPAASLQYVERWLAQFPKNPRLLRVKLDLLEATATRQEVLEFLDHLLALHPKEPFFLARLAAALKEDDRELSRAQRLVQRALKTAPTDPDLLGILGDVLWKAGRLAEAAMHYRLAACAAQHNEHLAESYFSSLLHLRQSEAGLAFLRRRFDELGHLSSVPAMTLFKCLAYLGRTEEGFAVLEEARNRRPEDGELMLFYADALARHGRAAPAQQLLEQARGHARHSHWLRVAAQLAVYRADLRQALACWQEVLQVEPLAMDAQAQVYQLLAETHDLATARAHLEEMCRRFPGHCGLLRLRAEKMAQEPLAVAEPALQALLAANPVDTEARCDLALRYAAAGRHAEALAEAERAITLTPRSPKIYTVRGDILRQLGRRAEARADYEQALRLDVNNGHAMMQLVELSATEEERAAALDFIQAELVRQVVFEEALPAFRDAAHGLLPPEKVLARLREALAARPDLWAAWWVVVLQLKNMHQLEEALALAQQACQRFPLVPQLWLEQADVLRVQGRGDAAVAAVEQALTINPRFGRAVYFLANLHAKNGQLEKARQTLLRGLAHAPLEAPLHVALAEIALRENDDSTAIQEARVALQMDPACGTAWEILQYLARERQMPRLAVEMAEALTQARPGDPEAWLMLADCLAQQGSAGCLEAVDRAIALNPRLEKAHEEKARFLTLLDRCDEALAVCLEGPLQPPPFRLRLRAAWIESQRGHLPAAIQLMESVLAESPAHYGALNLLCAWQKEMGQYDQALATAEKMVAMAPHEAEPLRVLAELHYHKGNKSAAVATLRRAVELNPSQEENRHLLMGLLIGLAEETGDGTEAWRFLEQERARRISDLLLAFEIRLLLLQGEVDAAQGRFAALCRMKEGEDEWAMFNALDNLVDRVPVSTVTQLVRQALEPLETQPAAVESPPCHAYLGAMDIHLRFLEGRFTLPAYLDRVSRHSAFFKNSLAQYLKSAADAYHRAMKYDDLPFPWLLHRQVQRLGKQHQQWLRTDARLAAKYGRALLYIGKYQAAREWFASLHQQGEMPADMYSDWLEALLAGGQWQAAETCLEKALAMRQSQAAHICFCAAAACLCAMNGQLENARHFLAQIHGQPLDDSVHCLQGLAQIWVELDTLGTPGTWAATRALVRKLDKGLLGSIFFWHPAPVRQLYLESIRRWRQSGKWPGLGLWRWWRQFRWGWFLLPVLPLAFAVVYPPSPAGRRWVRRCYTALRR
ncbi:tetratricopeptide repeat protein [Fontisphaera persica]|uniref:tetratricopeptide repeat protein n=1 Tax=Fontisphaera persica TaxID=2974023 RepID=UPI0024C04F35|nr:tetratricopeptide repeat protein [Fontisphaera persica]WCJ59006.1 tetratricopeptide repeat protein [Fontisphaera persica]